MFCPFSTTTARVRMQHMVRTWTQMQGKKEVSILEMILGDEEGSVCGLNDGALDIKQGEQHLNFRDSIAFTASPNDKPTEIWFLAMPYAREDVRLRPAIGSARIASLARWP
ncbi:hypothetical protein K503DRAFT_178915 [Rhizopogon vinicolor AM-OR11-026]|uniref:Uncharacterized protein n=1 Tax=Rhizopogon vinicolor AM-OR11-026 TaxID=1314800 RepID=A0A1B7MZZ8_9AGAM|nr:hypothetical protein K503DRAFT_178915 [Rhizopogon vinicolor AM-OR11-026]